jgi:hypothetical protein
VTDYSLVQVTDVSEELSASLFIVEEYGEELAFLVFSLDPEDGNADKLPDCLASHTRI